MPGSSGITAVVNAHREGLLLKPTISSVLQAANLCREGGQRVNVLVVCDNPDEHTLSFLHTFRSAEFRTILTSHSDPGLARQSAAEAAETEWICYIDGDDLWGINWITEAHRCATADGRAVVWHPECSLYFGASTHIFPHVDMESPEFDLKFLATNNYWTSSIFTRTSAVISTPFLRSAVPKRLGHEDWNWHCRAIEAGYIHKVVPGTSHFIRRRAQSVSGSAIAHQAMCLPHQLFAASPYSFSSIFAEKT